MTNQKSDQSTKRSRRTALVVLRRQRSRSFDNQDELVDKIAALPSLRVLPKTQPPKERSRRGTEKFLPTVKNIHVTPTIDTQTAKKPAFRRLRSRSFDAIETFTDPLHKYTLPSLKGASADCALESLRTTTAAADVSDVEMLAHAPKLFWRTRMRAHLFIYHHKRFDCFEVVAYSYNDDKELNRIYVPCAAVFDVIKESAGMHLVRSTRADLVGKALLNCSCDYLISAVEAEKRGLDPVPTLFLRRYDGAANELRAVDVMRPYSIIPTNSSFITSVVESSKRAADEKMAASIQDMRNLADEVRKCAEQSERLEHDTERGMKAMASAAPARYWNHVSTVNPNAYSIARWRWIWAIEKIRTGIRMMKNMAALFKAANKGKLYSQQDEIDQASLPDILHVSVMMNRGQNGPTPPAPPIRSLHIKASQKKQTTTSDMIALVKSFEDSKMNVKGQRGRKKAMMHDSVEHDLMRLRCERREQAVVRSSFLDTNSTSRSPAASAAYKLGAIKEI